MKSSRTKPELKPRGLRLINEDRSIRDARTAQKFMLFLNFRKSAIAPQ
jgi:hypothetical protein